MEDKIDPRELTREQLIQALLELQDQAIEISNYAEELKGVITAQQTAQETQSNVLAYNTGRLNNIAALLTNQDKLIETLVRDYYTIVMRVDQTPMAPDALRSILRLASSLISIHILKILVGSEGDLTSG